MSVVCLFSANCLQAFLCIIFRRGVLLGRQPCRPIWCSVRRMSTDRLTPPTPSTSAAMLAALIRLFPKHNLWIWHWARALKCPPQSPDLNPIEHLWDVVEREIHIMDVQPTNLQQLHDAIISIWTKISEEFFQHLVESMTRRIKAVLKAKGVQPGTSKLYLMKWPVSVYIDTHSHITLYI